MLQLHTSQYVLYIGAFDLKVVYSLNMTQNIDAHVQLMFSSLWMLHLLMQGKKVDGNDVGAVHVKLKRTYRWVCCWMIPWWNDICSKPWWVLECWAVFIIQSQTICQTIFLRHFWCLFSLVGPALSPCNDIFNSYNESNNTSINMVVGADHS